MCVKNLSFMCDETTFSLPRMTENKDISQKVQSLKSIAKVQSCAMKKTYKHLGTYAAHHIVQIELIRSTTHCLIVLKFCQPT